MKKGPGQTQKAAPRPNPTLNQQKVTPCPAIKRANAKKTVPRRDHPNLIICASGAGERATTGHTTASTNTKLATSVK